MRRNLMALSVFGILVSQVAPVPSSSLLPSLTPPAFAVAGLPSPSRFKGYARQAYQAAHDNYSLASKLFCYCGCDHVQKHKRLIDCFRNEHAVSCSICQDEMIRAANYKKQGLSTSAIAKKIDAEFRSRYPYSGKPSSALKSYQRLHRH